MHVKLVELGDGGRQEEKRRGHDVERLDGGPVADNLQNAEAGIAVAVQVGGIRLGLLAGRAQQEHLGEALCSGWLDQLQRQFADGRFGHQVATTPAIAAHAHLGRCRQADGT